MHCVKYPIAEVHEPPKVVKEHLTGYIVCTAMRIFCDIIVYSPYSIVLCARYVVR